VDLTNMFFERKKTGDNLKINTPSKRKKPRDEAKMNTPFELKKPGNESNREESDCKIIVSPAWFGLFDLSINRALNEQSPLYQQLLSSVKVSNHHILVVYVSS
jgi:hypothetical protein